MTARTELNTVNNQAQLLVDDSTRPDTYDVELAARAVKVHCAVRHWPDGERCLNCGWPHPCVTYRWGRKILVADGWTEREIAALDSRTGVWW
ncbi:MAG TPA: hypothetical protein VFB74_16375 [Kribbellaceae bacterium]|nr:hypothetical protein [Kribbellaceae bacterium]